MDFIWLDVNVQTGRSSQKGLTMDKKHIHLNIEGCGSLYEAIIGDDLYAISDYRSLEKFFQGLIKALEEAPKVDNVQEEGEPKTAFAAAYQRTKENMTIASKVAEESCQKRRNEKHDENQSLTDYISKESKDNPGTQAIYGWICPKCGGGNSPYSYHCPCVPTPIPPVTC